MPRIDEAAGPLTIRRCLLFASVLGAFLFLLRCPQARAAGLIVYGANWAFTVDEPHGWTGDIQGAKLYNANIIFYRQGESASDAAAAIRIVVATKADEDTARDLAYDMNEYHKRYPAVQFHDIAIPAGRYREFPKLFCVPGEFYEYLTYLNPGPSSALLLSVAMNTGKRPAGNAELYAYRSVIGSLTVMSGVNVQKKANPAN